MLGLVELVERASSRLFGIPGHTIRLHNVFDIYTDQVGHLVTVQTPTGTTMASGPVDLRPANAHDACDMLRLCATYVDSALAEPADPVGDLAPGRARPFPNLNATPRSRSTPRRHRPRPCDLTTTAADGPLRSGTESLMSPPVSAPFHDDAPTQRTASRADAAGRADGADSTPTRPGPG